MKQLLPIFIVLFSVQTHCQEPNILRYPSGDNEIDSLRIAINRMPTDRTNYNTRILMMKLWAVTLQQQGVNLGKAYMEVDQHLNRFSKWNPVFKGGEEQIYTDADIKEFAKVVKNGYAELDRLQERLHQNDELAGFEHKLIIENENSEKAEKNNIDWSNYRGNAQRTGFTGADGPIHGVTAWKFPVGLRWESKPVVVENNVYLTSPGMRNILWTLDLETGKVKNLSTHIPKMKGDQLYSTPAMASTPVVLNDYVLLREMGSRGNKGISKHIVFINRKTGKVDRKMEAGHVDYRAGFVSLEANEKYTVYSFAVHDIEERPPLCSPMTRIIAKDTKTGNRLWDFNIGPHYAAPLLDDSFVYVGTGTGDVFCLDVSGKYGPASAKRIKWQFQAEGSVNRKTVISNGCLYFGDNAGNIYCLDKNSGDLKWKYKSKEIEENAFRQFTTPTIQNGLLFIGAAFKKMLILDAKSGDFVDEYPTSDWVKSRPVAFNNDVYISSMNGEVSKLTMKGRSFSEVWKVKATNHFVYGELTFAKGKLLFTDSDLFAYALDAKTGTELWKHSIIKSFQKEDGYRILTDQIAGGAYYESKPTAIDGTVLIGTPSGFVYAIDAVTGKEKWKFEVGGAVSGAPIVDQGKVYIGTEGAEEDFYCLDLKTGNVIWKQLVSWVWGSANVSEGLVYVPGVDGYVNCLDGDTGAIIWRYRTERSTCTEPLIIEDYVYFGSWDHYLYKFHKKTGEFIWKYQLSGGSDSGAPISGEGKIFLPVGGGVFRCLDPTTKKVLWTPDLKGKMYNVTPGYHDGKVYLSCLNGRGIGGIPIGAEVFSVDAKNGMLNWTFNGGGGLTGPVIGANNRIYFASTVSPYVYCVDEKGNGDGTTGLYWKVRMDNKTEESVPALYNGMLYVLNSGGYLTAIK
ncbi:PQQ-binding-like beta-propeller repeat protein [Galbibacter sp. BG1]|uniref:outer membrane protein assembly factor BamB family protein n=1 Tax=Galbibacter sp. BG1 TaxID=1170699 RepID=UPI0015BB7A6D|nr:PQQ-binding-like beta-propeller repeat protein [Galbibacter sp. BG1]QLE02455.1 PQQ-binding-like beta-propeller repeat protein [Galbibacter sp. BG1]